METTALETALTAVKGDVLSAINGVAPIALPIMGAILVWRVGISIFKKVSRG